MTPQDDFPAGRADTRIGRGRIAGMTRTLIFPRAAALAVALVAGFELGGKSAQKAYRAMSAPALPAGAPERAGLYEPHPHLVVRLRSGASGANAGKSIAITRNRTRWTGAPDSATTRVAVLGGSTTFGMGMSDADSWPALLQTALGAGYAVDNHGVLGYSSTEAVIQAALTLPETRPDVVVFHGGWNDIRNYHRPEAEPDGWSAGMEQFEVMGLSVPTANAEDALRAAAAKVSFAARTAAAAGKAVEAATGWPGKDDPALSRLPDSRIDRLYSRNLRTLRALAWREGAAVIFVPQTLNNAEFAGRTKGRRYTPRIVDDAMPGLMARFNGVMREACAAAEPGWDGARAEAGRCVYAGAAAEAGWCPADFADDGHLSRAGGLKLSEIVAREVRRLPARLARETAGD